jgi:hypothetical protein
MKYTLKQIETEEEFIQVFGRNPRFSILKRCVYIMYTQK